MHVDTSVLPCWRADRLVSSHSCWSKAVVQAQSRLGATLGSRPPTQQLEAIKQPEDQLQLLLQERRRNDLGLTTSLLHLGPVSTGFPLPLWYSGGSESEADSASPTARERYLQRLKVRLMHVACSASRTSSAKQCLGAYQGTA